MIEHLDLDGLKKMAENIVSLIIDHGCRTVAFPLFMSNASVDVEVVTLFLDRFKESIKIAGLQHFVQIHFYGDSKATCLTFTEKTDAIFRKASFPVDFYIHNYVNTRKLQGQGIHTFFISMA